MVYPKIKVNVIKCTRVIEMRRYQGKESYKIMDNIRRIMGKN